MTFIFNILLQAAPYQSPTHAGGLAAVDREWFLQLGGYDPGLPAVWGGEQFELSFKATAQPMAG